MSTKKKSNTKKKAAKDTPLKSLQDIPPVEPDNEVLPPEETPAKLRQVEIPGTEVPRIKVIDEASEQYVNDRDRRQAATVKEVASKKLLSDLMHKHAEDIGRTPEGALIYKYDDMCVTLSPKEEVLKVKHVEPEDAGVVSVGPAPADTSEGD